jgi:hypothetical protein
MWRRRRGSTRRAARVPGASLLGPRGPGSDPPSHPTNLHVALRARGLAGPAVTPPSSGRDHLRGDVRSAPRWGPSSLRSTRGGGPPGRCATAAAAPPPSLFVCSCRSAHCGRTPSITACPKSGPKRGGVYIRPCIPLSPPSIRRAELEPLPRAGPAGPLRRCRCPAALVVVPPLLLRSAAGGRHQALLAS